MISEKEKQQLCIVCQECCISIDIDVPKEQMTNELKYYFDCRGFLIHDAGYKFVVEIPTRCPQLTTAFGCKIYADRPKTCRKYDGRKDVWMKDRCKWVSHYNSI